MANVSRATWSATGAFDPGYFRERFVVGAAQYDMISQAIFKVIASDKRYERFSSFGGFTNFVTKNEGVDITFETPGEGYNDSFEHTTYAKGFSYTREAMEDEMYRELGQLAEDLGTAAANLVETTAANILNNAFDSGYTYGDGKELCATDHPVLLTGGTEQNELSSAADLSYTSLNQAIVDMAATVDAAGKLAPQRPNVLIVHPSERVTAGQILGSDVTSSALQKNMFAGALQLVVWDFLTDIDTFFLLDPRHRLTFMWRRPLMFERWPDYRAQTESYAGSMRFSVGPAGDWRGIYGGLGA